MSSQWLKNAPDSTESVPRSPAPSSCFNKVSVRQPHPLMYVYVVHLSFISVIIFMVFILHIYFGFIVVEGDSADI